MTKRGLIHFFPQENSHKIIYFFLIQKPKKMIILFLLLFFNLINCEMNISDALENWEDLNWEPSRSEEIMLGKASEAFLENYDDYMNNFGTV